MASVNKVILVGNCGRDPEIRYLPSGGAVANISIATTSRRKDRTSGEMVEETQWHRVTFFERLAEIVGEYVKKGSPIYVEGRLTYRKYTDKDGIERTSVEIVANEMIMLSGREEGAEMGQGGGRAAVREEAPAERSAPRQGAPAGGGRQPQRPSRPAADDYDSDLDDVPF